MKDKIFRNILPLRAYAYPADAADVADAADMLLMLMKLRAALILILLVLLMPSLLKTDDCVKVAS